MFPERQRFPHGSWGEEVRQLNAYFGMHFCIPKLTIDNGDAYVVGNLIGDHWYLYMTNPASKASQSASLIPSHPSCSQLPVLDETLEILMTHLDDHTSRKFYLDETNERSVEGHEYGSVLADICGLTEIFPIDPHSGGRLDGYAFAPCGFSANAVVPTPGNRFTSTDSGHYFTVHVTPEQGYSYASFETNVPDDMFPDRGTGDVVARVVKGFRPGRMCITRFVSHRRKWAESESEYEFGRDSGFVDDVREKWNWQVDGYRRCERVVYEFDGYDLIFASYVRCE
jgi:S-adenosylmethionine decarboxylase